MKSQRGFTLVELAIVLVILGILTGGLIIPLGTQFQLLKQRDNQQQLEQLAQSLLGFYRLHGRLPCPASADSQGLEASAPDRPCRLLQGLVPGRTLGQMGSYDEKQRLLDAYGQPWRYSLSGNDSDGNGRWDWAQPQGLSDSKRAQAQGQYRICQALDARGQCLANAIEQEGMVAVIYSYGDQWAPRSALEQANQGGRLDTLAVNADADFVHQSFIQEESRAFDDQLYYLSPLALLAQTTP